METVVSEGGGLSTNAKGGESLSVGNETKRGRNAYIGML